MNPSNQPQFKDDLLNGGVQGRYYVSSSEPDTAYIALDIKKQKPSSGDEWSKWSVRRVSYSIATGAERKELGQARALDDCVEDYRAPKPIALRLAILRRKVKRLASH